MDAAPEVDDKPAALERFGAWYLRQRTAVAKPETTAADRQREVTRLERFVVMRAALAGALSSVLAGGMEIWAKARFPGDDFDSQLKFWSIVGGITAVAAVGEIAFLYWDSLRSTHRLAKIVGVEAWLGRGEYREAFARSLARAALELPNTRKPVHGVDPLHEASKATLVIASLAYKLKVAASTLILKLLIRRVISRAAMRSVLPLVAVPVTAVWNGIVSFRVIREARVRAGGPAAVQRSIDKLFGTAAPHSLTAREAILRAVASTIVRTQDLHPNVFAFFDGVRRHCSDVTAKDIGLPSEFLALLPKLDAKERAFALEALVIAATIDGKLTRKEQQLLVSAHAAAGLPATPDVWRKRLADPLQA
jgi:hypothetical protein